MYKKIFDVFGTLVLSTVLLLPTHVDAESLGKRLAGTNRYETGAKIVQEGWTTSDYAVIASGEGFADALCAAPLAQQYKAPILLTSENSLNTDSKNQLLRLKVKKVFIIGGTGVVSDNVKSELEGMSIETTRIYGQNRFETAIQVAKNLKSVNGVVVTNGYGFADALSIAPVAAQKGMPILLTDKDDLSSSVKEFLANSSYDKSYIVGGNGVVSDKIAAQLKNNTRLGGTSRYDTNASVLNQFADEFNYDKVYVASGENYPDALSGSVLAASNNSPLLLVGTSVDSSVESSIKAQHEKYNNVIVLGGTGVVSDTLANSIVSGVFISSTGDNSIVTFADKKLEEAVRNTINKHRGALYESDVEKITELNAALYEIQDLSGIENLTNLQQLSLEANSVSDISGLNGLSNLKKLDLSGNGISDISPLKGLTNLKELNLGENKISDISVLEGLTNLQGLDIQGNNIGNISPLKGLSNLQRLSLNELSDADKQALKDALPKCDIQYPICVEKPNIYLYPEKTEEVSVYINPKGKITKSIPEYNQGWTVKVDSTGKIDNKYDFLFYEAVVNYQFTLNKGWIVNKDNFNGEMNSILTSIGLNSKEKSDFIEYWSKRLNWQSSKYVAYYLDPKEIDEAIKLNLSKEPDSILRTYFYFVPLNDNENLEIKKPEIKEFKRNGFTVVEWGGICK